MSRLLSVAALSVALFSCADEEIVGGGPRVQEGLPAKIVRDAGEQPLCVRVRRGWKCL